MYFTMLTLEVLSFISVWHLNDDKGGKESKLLYVNNVLKSDTDSKIKL